ncbi:MAG: kelch repeat-containing protein [Chthonomonadales bacterium]
MAIKPVHNGPYFGYLNAVLGIFVLFPCTFSKSESLIAKMQHHQSVYAAKYTSNWKPRKSMSVPAVFAATVTGRDGKIYVLSGSTAYDVNLTGAVRIYNPKTDSWSAGSPIPTPRTSAGAVVGPDGLIYVAGGLDKDNKKNAFEAYNPATNSWKRLEPVPTPRDATQAVAARGKDGRTRIYVIGGRDRRRRGNGMTVVEAYDPDPGTWSTVAPMIINLHAHMATVGPDGRIYVIGGTNDKVFATDALQIYDPISDSWTFGPPMPYGQECAAATFTPGANGEVLVFGGWTKEKRPVSSVAAYSPRTGKWRLLKSGPHARAAGGAVTIVGKNGIGQVYVIGGTEEDSSGNVQTRHKVESSVEQFIVR